RNVHRCNSGCNHMFGWVFPRAHPSSHLARRHVAGGRHPHTGVMPPSRMSARGIAEESAIPRAATPVPAGAPRAPLGTETRLGRGALPLPRSGRDQLLAEARFLL